MTTATIVQRPERFDRVDRVKEAAGQPVLPGDDRFWILGDPLVIDVDGQLIEVPAGFTTDGASVPDWAQRFTSWGPWEDPQRWAGVTHDWLYGQPGVSKAYADDVFRAILKSEGAGPVKRNAMYWAVKVGGWPAYWQNQNRGPRIFNRSPG